MGDILRLTLIGLGAGVIGTGSGAFIALFLKSPGQKMLSFFLGFAGGAMLYIIFGELIPGARMPVTDIPALLERSSALFPVFCCLQ